MSFGEENREELTPFFEEQIQTHSFFDNQDSQIESAFQLFNSYQEKDQYQERGSKSPIRKLDNVLIDPMRDQKDQKNAYFNESKTEQPENNDTKIHLFLEKQRKQQTINKPQHKRSLNKFNFKSNLNIIKQNDQKHKNEDIKIQKKMLVLDSIDEKNKNINLRNQKPHLFLRNQKINSPFQKKLYISKVQNVQKVQQKIMQQKPNENQLNFLKAREQKTADKPKINFNLRSSRLNQQKTMQKYTQKMQVECTVIQPITKPTQQKSTVQLPRKLSLKQELVRRSSLPIGKIRSILPKDPTPTQNNCPKQPPTQNNGCKQLPTSTNSFLTHCHKLTTILHQVEELTARRNALQSQYCSLLSLAHTICNKLP